MREGGDGARQRTSGNDTAPRLAGARCRSIKRVSRNQNVTVASFEHFVVPASQTLYRYVPLPFLLMLSV